MTDLHEAFGRSSRLDQALRSLLTSAPEIEAAAVVSFDGLPMASALPAGMDEDRVAAMSAALLSLGDRAAQGLGRGDLSQVYVEGAHGTVFLVSADEEAVLVAVAAKQAKVGMMLFEVRRAAEAVAAALVADDHEAELAEVAAEAAAAAAAVAAFTPPRAQHPGAEQVHVEPVHDQHAHGTEPTDEHGYAAQSAAVAEQVATVDHGAAVAQSGAYDDQDYRTHVEPNGHQHSGEHVPAMVPVDNAPGFPPSPNGDAGWQQSEPGWS